MIRQTLLFVYVLSICTIIKSDTQTALSDWLRSNGAHFDGLSLQSSGNRDLNHLSGFALNRPGLFTTRTFKEGEVLASLPNSLFFNYSAPIASSESEQADLTAFMEHVVMEGHIGDAQSLVALRVLYEQQHLSSGSAHSWWSSFFSTLPSKPLSVCLWSESELESLQLPSNAPLVSARTQLLTQVELIYSGLKPLLSPPLCGDDATDSTQKCDAGSTDRPANAKAWHLLFPKGWTLEQWQWAYFTVLNVAIELATADNVGSLVLTPLYHLINHANPPHHNVRLHHSYGEDGKSSLQLIATRDININEELFLTYGSFSAWPISKSNNNEQESEQKETQPEPYLFFPTVGLSNTQLLLHYGISVPHNEYERISMDTTMAVEGENEQVTQWKDYIVQLNSLSLIGLVGIDGEFPAPFLQSMRTKHLSEQDLKHLSKFKYEFSPDHGYLSLQNELKVYLHLLSSIEDLLSQYPTKLETDIADFAVAAQSSTSSVQIFSLGYKVAVKRVLHVVLLRSLQELSTIFEQLIERWARDLEVTLPHQPAQDTQEPGKSEQTRPQLSRIVSPQQKSAWLTSVEKWAQEVQEYRTVFATWVSSILGHSSFLPAPSTAPLELASLAPETLTVAR